MGNRRRRLEGSAPAGPPLDLRPVRHAGLRGLGAVLRDRWDRPVFFALASVSLIALGATLFFIFREAAPVLREIGLGNFFGRVWDPTGTPASYGALPMIVGSAMVTIAALIASVPLGFAAAAFIAEVAPRWMKDVAKSVLELLAGVPSVIYGFFGLMVVAPAFQSAFHLGTGRTALTASVILGIMALPTVASLAEDALTAVPNSYREASMALGATRWQTIRNVTFPAAFSGLIGAAILGMGRAIGETMAVLMVAGNAPQITASLLKPVRTLTGAIALEMGETAMGSTHYHALFGLGVILLVIALITNGLAEWLRGRLARKHGL